MCICPRTRRRYWFQCPTSGFNVCRSYPNSKLLLFIKTNTHLINKIEFKQMSKSFLLNSNRRLNPCVVLGESRMTIHWSQLPQENWIMTILGSPWPWPWPARACDWSHARTHTDTHTLWVNLTQGQHKGCPNSQIIFSSLSNKMKVNKWLSYMNCCQLVIFLVLSIVFVPQLYKNKFILGLFFFFIALKRSNNTSLVLLYTLFLSCLVVLTLLTSDCFQLRTRVSVSDAEVLKD